MVHVNDGTLNDEAIIPFGGMGESGNGGRYGGEASLDTFTDWQWVTVRAEPPTSRSEATRHGIHHRRGPAGRGLDGHGVARGLRVTVRGQRRRPAPASSTRPGPSTTSRTRSRAGCSRATSRSSGSSSTTSPTRTSPRSCAASRTRRAAAASWSSPAAPTATPSARTLRPPAPFDACGDADLRRQRSRRPGARTRRWASTSRRSATTARRSSTSRPMPSARPTSASTTPPASRAWSPSWPARPSRDRVPRRTHSLYVARERLEGYRRGLAEAGLAVRRAPGREQRVQPRGRRARHRHAAGRVGAVHAVCSANDLLALGALQRLAELGIAVPDDVSVAGFDDIQTAAIAAPGCPPCGCRCTRSGDARSSSPSVSSPAATRAARCCRRTWCARSTAPPPASGCPVPRPGRATAGPPDVGDRSRTGSSSSPAAAAASGPRWPSRPRRSATVAVHYHRSPEAAAEVSNGSGPRRRGPGVRRRHRRRPRGGPWSPPSSSASGAWTGS